MIKYGSIFASVLFIILVFITWRTSEQFSSLVSIHPSMQSSKDSEMVINTVWYEENPSFTDESSRDADKSADIGNHVHYETIEETITRIKRDVIVTGTITGEPGQEMAMFQIEGMADKLFKVGTQLMDGFIIKIITTSNVVLKNQIGNETFSLDVQTGNKDRLSSSVGQTGSK